MLNAGGETSDSFGPAVARYTPPAASHRSSVCVQQEFTRVFVIYCRAEKQQPDIPDDRLLPWFGRPRREHAAQVHGIRRAREDDGHSGHHRTTHHEP